KTLAGLSKEQMTAVLAALEKASKTTGNERDGELKKAQELHVQIVLTLKGLLARFDAVRSLEQAADRLDKMSRDVAEQWLASAQLLYESAFITQVKRKGSIPGRLERLMADTSFTHKDFTELLAQVNALADKVPADQREWVKKLQQMVKADKITDRF